MDGIGMAQSMEFSGRVWQLLMDLSIRLLTWTVTSGTRIVLIGILGWIALIVLRRTMTYLHRALVGTDTSMDHVKRADTLTAMVKTLGLVFIVIAASMMVLGEIGIDIAPILATAGIGGLAVGFGAQSLVKDVISGFFLLVEDQVRVGDVVDIDGRGGQVEKLTLRTMSIRDLAGNVHVVPHGSVSVVMNRTKDYSRCVFDVGVAYREDPDHVFEVLTQIGEEMRADRQYGNDILEPLEILGVDAFADSAVIIKARFKTLPMRQWNVGREFNRRMKKRFDELDIEIPFPHLTLYPGGDKQHRAAPLHVAVSTEEPGRAPAPDHQRADR